MSVLRKLGMLVVAAPLFLLPHAAQAAVTSWYQGPAGIRHVAAAPAVTPWLTTQSTAIAAAEPVTPWFGKAGSASTGAQMAAVTVTPWLQDEGNMTLAAATSQAASATWKARILAI